MLQALAHHAGGEVDAALTVLSQALSAAPEPESHVRLFLDEGAPMLALLRDAADDRVAVGPLSDRDHEEEQETKTISRKCCARGPDGCSSALARQLRTSTAAAS